MQGNAFMVILAMKALFLWKD
uniref:Uncharacterized protein n=1 Tax=Rhizophora mucronata TaxID=61149 RepID=A0A2P2N2T3_RHIMU